MNAQLVLELGDDERESPPPDADARRRIADDTTVTMFVEAGAGTGKTTALVGRILTLVEQGADIESIAAITFSEKAAAELRHRLRDRLTEDGHRAALDALDRAPIGTLHAFARRLLFEFPVEAGLPPGFVVLDELESRLALDERWEDLLDELFDDADREVAPGLSAADLMLLCGWNRLRRTDGLRRISEEFQANWDLVEARVPLEPPERPGPPATTWLAEVKGVVATPTPADDRQSDVLAELADAADALGRDARLSTVLGGLERIKQVLGKPARCGNKAKWNRLGVDALEDLRAAEQVLLDEVERQLTQWRLYQQDVVGAIVGRFVLDGARARAAAGTLEFHDLLVLARRLLVRDEAVRRSLSARFRCLLLDEFQDTDPIQLDIATRLATPDDAGLAGSTAVPPNGRLFVVGDPKQSIYRFRRADITTYLEASAKLAERNETLTANFRSTRLVVEWINGVFSEVIQAADGIQPRYTPLDACRPGAIDHGRVVVLGAAAHEELTARQLREREAASVAGVVRRALDEAWPVGDGDGGLRPCRAGDIAVLLPARTSLPMLEVALSSADVPYRAENSTIVYLAPEVRDLLGVLRAAADPTDELALVAALRSPLYGCSDVELYEWRLGGGGWNLFAPPPEPLLDHPVAEAIADVRAIAQTVGHLGPAALLERLVERRRVLESALAGPHARDVWRRVRYVVDQARAWTDAGGRGLRRYLRWARYQAADGRAGDTILPERDHDAVRIMTVHAAKGLEFPITVLSGLTTKPRGRNAMSVVWPPDGGWALAQKDHPLFEEFRPIDEQMSDAERRRLLYVACTRAVDHLVVSLHRQPEKLDAGTAKATSATVLAEAGASGFGAVDEHGRGDGRRPPRAAPQPLVLPWADRVQWDAERRRALATASIRSVTSATRVAHDGPVEAVDEQWSPAVLAPDDPGLRKEGVDLDLPPWQRGRYGTAIGRAVHAVLQDVDLLDGVDVDRLSAAQCAAEGIFGFEDRVSALCRSALDAPIVRAAAHGAEHWRELFVVTEVGATVVEGYVDLLVRTPSGLVIVDYKTDGWTGDADRAVRVARYRRQLAVYGTALGCLLEEPIAGGVIVWCRPDGPATQLDVLDWAEALDEVRQVLAPTG